MNTAVLLCNQGLETSNPLERTEATVIDDLCRHPELIAAAVDDADRLVLGVCDREYSLGAIQAEVRRAGIDPLGIELIDLTANRSDDGALEVVVRARIARAEGFAGSTPANAKISLPRAVNRRELLRGPPHEYHSAPSIDAHRCTAESGCRACVDVCPQNALSVLNRRVVHDRSVCEPCGLCVTTCPTGATVNPATTPRQLEAEIIALLDSSVGPSGTRAIVFTCVRGSRPAVSGAWHAVTVPCTGMVTPAWLLAPLLMGAGTVAVRPCRDSGCGLGLDARTTTAVEFCRELLRSVGESPDRVSTEPISDPPDPLPTTTLEDPFGPHGSVEVIRALAAGRPQFDDLLVDHAGATTGTVQLHADACTACAMCAHICPTDALASVDTGDRVKISFDAAACTACGQCIPTCPELDRGAISLRVGVDLAALSSGRRTLLETEMKRCESCGGPIAPAPMLARIASMLGPDQDRVRAMITSRCVACRGKSR